MISPAQPASAASTSGPVLRDIHLPASPPWWPPAPGWWVLAALLLISLQALVWLLRRRHAASLRRQRILDELEQFKSRHARDGDHAALAGALHQLLRRVARRHVAGAAQQRGDAWRDTLARVPVDAVTLDRLIALESAIYRPPSSFDDSAAVIAVRQWLSLALKPKTWKAASAEKANG
jgi:hypothetical protein